MVNDQVCSETLYFIKVSDRSFIVLFSLYKHDLLKSYIIAIKKKNEIYNTFISLTLMLAYQMN